MTINPKMVYRANNNLHDVHVIKLDALNVEFKDVLDDNISLTTTIKNFNNIYHVLHSSEVPQYNTKNNKSRLKVQIFKKWINQSKFSTLYKILIVIIVFCIITMWNIGSDIIGQLTIQYLMK